MTTTKPARQRPQPAARKAPTYPRLAAAGYAALDEAEQARHDAHLDIDAVYDALPYAELDRRSIGFAASSRPQDGSRSTDEGALNAVEAASQRPDPSVDWLAERLELRALLVRVARLARFHWGFDPDRGRDDPARPHDRRSEAGVCVWCGDPTTLGARDANGQPLTRLVDGRIPIHTRPCYDTATKQAHRAGVGILAVVQMSRPDRHRP